MNYFEDGIDVKYHYGTSGFRFDHKIIEDIAVRVGIGIAVISHENNDKIYGIMITASHNPENYNGFKIIESNGEMLSNENINFLIKLVNCNEKEFKKFILHIRKIYEIKNSIGNILIGWDWRPSSTKIRQEVCKGLQLINCNYKLYGLVTTPQFHCFTKDSDYHYYKKLCSCFIRLVTNEQIKFNVTVDCANGTGSKIMKRLNSLLSNNIKFNLINTTNKNNINYRCGSDYVYNFKKFPNNLSKTNYYDLVASLDGDAGRLICSFVDKVDKKINIINGDKIASLFLAYIHNLCYDENKDNYSLGLIVTGYTNQKLIKYVNKNSNVGLQIAQTGIKYLHEKAKNFDIAIYSEPCGHINVLTKPHVLDDIYNKIVKLNDNYYKLYYFLKIFNECCGDAVVNLLASIIVLQQLKIGFSDWHQLYTEYPHILENIDLDINKKISLNTSELTSKYADYKIFTRKSGTENKLRIYIEGKDKSIVKEIYNEIKKQIIK